MNKLGSGQAIAVPADLQKLSEVERLVQEISAKEKALHVLVNNAGATWGAGINQPLQSLTPVLNGPGKAPDWRWVRGQGNEVSPPESLYQTG